MHISFYTTRGWNRQVIPDRVVQWSTSWEVFLSCPCKSSSCLWLFLFPPYDNFKPTTSLLPTSQKCNNYHKATYIVSSNLCLFTCPQVTDFPWNPYTHRGILVQRVFLKFIPLFLVLTFQVIYQYPRSVRVNIKKTEHDTTFEISKLSKPLGEKHS